MNTYLTPKTPGVHTIRIVEVRSVIIELHPHIVGGLGTVAPHVSTSAWCPSGRWHRTHGWRREH